MTANKEFIKNVLSYLFEELNSRNICYCVLKNYHGLPEALNAQDVDILVEGRDMGKVKAILVNLKAGGQVDFGIFSRRGNVNRYDLLQSDGDKNSVLTIEFWTGIDWYCFPLFSNNDILGKRKKHKFFYVASPVYEALTCWLVPFMFGGKMKDRYIRPFFEVYKNSREEVASELRKVFGDNLTQKILYRLGQADINMYDLRNAMKLRILFSSFLRFRFVLLKNFLRLSYDVVRHALNKYSVVYRRGAL